MNKKIMLATTGLCMMACLLTACGNKEEGKTPVTPSESTKVEVETETEPTINKSDAVVENEKNDTYGDIQFIYGATSSKENIINGKPAIGDVVIIDGYQYTYNIVLADEHTEIETDFNGWSVYSIDKTRKTVDKIEEELFGIPVKSINYCYKGCEELTEVKTMPSNIESAVGAFESCAKLKTVCNLPEGLIDTRNMFAFCVELTGIPNMPTTLKTVDKMFYYCMALTGEFSIPESVETFNNIFGKTQNEIKITGKEDVVETITRAQWNVVKK